MVKQKVKSIAGAYNGRKVDLPEFNEVLFHRTISLKDSGIDIPLFTFWRRNGLIDFVENNKWTRLNYMQLVWIDVLLSLREFGLSLDKLKKLHNYFFKQAYADNVAKSYFEFKAIELESKIKKGEASENDKDKLRQIQSSLKNKMLMHIHNRDINYFSKLIMNFLNTREEVGILIFEDGTVAEYFNGKYHYFDEEKNSYDSLSYKLEFHPPYIYIPISSFIIKFLDKSFIDDYMAGLDVLTEDELFIIKEMRRHNIREIRIRLDQGKIKRIESDMDGNLSNEQESQIKNILGLRNYQKITLETRDKKTISFLKTIKIIK